MNRELNELMLLKMLSLSTYSFGRYRSADINNNHIVIYTRDGGNNRNCDCYNGEFECSGCRMSNVKNFKYYLYDNDDSFDQTYAEIHFEIPKEYKPLIKKIMAEQPYKDDPLYLSLKI